jgi:hypothetical protein
MFSSCRRVSTDVDDGWAAGGGGDMDLMDAAAFEFPSA